MVHRVTVGWCHGGRCGGRMYYPKADYLEKVKAITSYFRKEMANMWWSIGGGIIIFALGMFIFLKPGLIWKLTEEEFSKIQVSKNGDKNFRYIKGSSPLKILEIKL